MTLNWEGLNASLIHKLAICYFHCILESTIFGRINNHKVNSKELFFLHCIFTPTRINATPFLLAHIHSISERGTNTFCIGGIFTSITLALGLGNKLTDLPSIPSMYLDLDNCRSTHLIKVREDDKYYLMVQNKVVKSVVLPCRNRTNA